MEEKKLNTLNEKYRKIIELNYETVRIFLIMLLDVGKNTIKMKFNIMK